MGKKKQRRTSRRYEEDLTDTEDEGQNTYSLLPDTKSPFSCCCIFYRYLLDICLVLALSPFVFNCFLEATIYLIKFDWGAITWGKGILAFLVVTLWVSMAVFGILCCIAVMRKGVFTRRIRQKRKDLLLSQSQSALDEGDSMV